MRLYVMLGATVVAALLGYAAYEVTLKIRDSPLRAEAGDVGIPEKPVETPAPGTPIPTPEVNQTILPTTAPPEEEIPTADPEEWGPAPPAQYRCNMPYYGVNIAGAEFSENMSYPDQDGADRFWRMGMNHVRFPFYWRRIQWDLSRRGISAFEKWHWDQLVAFCKYATEVRGLTVILDSHGVEQPTPFIGDAALTAKYIGFWQDIASYPLFLNNPRIVFNVLNEPARVDADKVAKLMKDIVSGIRAIGANNMILVSGTRWGGAYSWTATWGAAENGRSNADAFVGFTDPADNFAFDLHQYFDKDSSGTHPDCKGEPGSVKIAAVTAWLRKNNFKAWMAEMAAGPGKNCATDLASLLDYMEQNADVWLGWTWWAAGKTWPKKYLFNIDEEGIGNIHVPEMRSRFINC